MFKMDTKVVAVYRVIGSVGQVTKGVSPPNMTIRFSLGNHAYVTYRFFNSSISSSSRCSTNSW